MLKSIGASVKTGEIFRSEWFVVSKSVSFSKGQGVEDQLLVTYAKVANVVNKSLVVIRGVPINWYR